MPHSLGGVASMLEPVVEFPWSFELIALGMLLFGLCGPSYCIWVLIIVLLFVDGLSSQAWWLWYPTPITSCQLLYNCFGTDICGAHWIFPWCWICPSRKFSDANVSHCTLDLFWILYILHQPPEQIWNVRVIFVIPWGHNHHTRTHCVFSNLYVLIMLCSFQYMCISHPF